MTFKLGDLVPKGDLTNKEVSTILTHVVQIDHHTAFRMADEIVRTRMLVLSIAAVLDNAEETHLARDQALEQIERMIRVEMKLREVP